MQLLIMCARSRLHSNIVPATPYYECVRGACRKSAARRYRSMTRTIVVMPRGTPLGRVVCPVQHTCGSDRCRKLCRSALAAGTHNVPHTQPVPKRVPGTRQPHVQARHPMLPRTRRNVCRAYARGRAAHPCDGEVCVPLKFIARRIRCRTS